MVKNKSQEPQVTEIPANKPFHLAFMQDDITILAKIQKMYGSITGKQAGGKRNIAVRIRLALRVFSQLDLSIEKVRKLNAAYEAENPDCQPITIGEA